VLDRRVVLIRPKMDLADDGNYRESRWFTAWPRDAPLGECRLHAVVTAVTGQTHAPIGGALLEAFWWMPFIFGAFLIITGIRMARHTDTTEHPEDSKILTLMRRVIPMTEDFRGSSMTVKENGKRLFTPLFVALLALAFFDLMFAVDSVPAIYAITDDPFIVLAANAFALLGLRTLYFAIATSLERFVYLQPTLAIVLGWVGFKMIISHWYHMPPLISLGVILTILGIGILASVRANRRGEQRAHG
jgi:tellurite resistance protein TerC